MSNGLIWLSVSSGRQLGKQQCTFQFRARQGISLFAEELLTFQEGWFSMKVVRY